MTTYTSTGTIRRLKISNGASGVRIFFVPDCHHSVRHDTALYAVFFIDSSTNSSKKRPDIQAVKYDPKKGCCFRQQCLPSALQPAIEQAAVNQCKVDIFIDVSESNNVSIDSGNFVGIAIPAK